jgi:hypothetical protein
MNMSVGMSTDQTTAPEASPKQNTLPYGFMPTTCPPRSALCGRHTSRGEWRAGCALLLRGRSRGLVSGVPRVISSCYMPFQYAPLKRDEATFISKVFLTFSNLAIHSSIFFNSQEWSTLWARAPVRQVAGERLRGNSRRKLTPTRLHAEHYPPRPALCGRQFSRGAWRAGCALLFARAYARACARACVWCPRSFRVI